MEFRLLLKNTSYLFSTKIVQFFVGILRSKINAIYLGTEGVGIVSQFLMLMKSSSSFTTLGMNEAVVKQIAQNSENNEKLIESSLKTYLITVMVFILFSSSLLYFFQEPITNYVFGSNEFINYFYLALISFPILIINGVFFAILKGFKAIKQIAMARIGIIISNILVFLPLVIIYKLDGAIAYLPISFITTLMWNIYFANRYCLKPKEIRFIDVIRAPLKVSFRNEMLNFSAYGLVISIMTVLSAFIGRSIVIENLGIDAIGLYSPIIAWSGLFTGFLLPSFNTYLFPRFSEMENDSIAASGVINDAIRLATFGLIPLLFLAIPYRYILIELFYSNEFLGAGDYLPIHFIGVAFNVWFVVLGQSMTPRGYIKQHSFFKFVFYGLNIFLAIYLVPLYGLKGWMLKFVISYIGLFFIYLLFLKSKTKMEINRSNLILMLFLLSVPIVLILMEIIFNSTYFGMFFGPLFLLLTYFIMSESEKKFIRSKLGY